MQWKFKVAENRDTPVESKTCEAVMHNDSRRRNRDSKDTF